MYLFSGSVELYEVTIHELLDDPDTEAKEGYRLKMVIRNFAGDYWGTVWYDYLQLRNEGKSGGKKKVVNPYRGEGLFTTIERLIEGKYIVFADYRFEVRRADSDDGSTDKLQRKVALGMELYHGDWKHLEGLIKDYEQSLQNLERSRTTGLSHMKEFDISSEDLPSTIYSQDNGETKKEERDSESEENESGEEDSFGEFVTAR
ncbi:DEKNAAC105582 [Brettanomyces naardenensis]|uniref:DEKNAAC105582 n=1 Tax=Brettanomyces naardenensis TaxID=13370 RepID=A0A448YU39_BRENA|nr:DEKNAAC105582 [Brettanomyces naardenensis]